MAEASLLGGCLAFGELDSGYEVDRAFAIGYRFQDVRKDLWTQRFSRFKAGRKKSQRAAARILGLATPVLLSKLNLDSRTVTFVPALSSEETIASEGRVLPAIARWCAKQCGSQFAIDLLRKKRHARLHGQIRTATERECILASAEYVCETVSTANMFVVDDLITRGSTLCAIAGAIKERNPGVTVYGLALAKNDRQSFLLDNGHAHYTNDHIPSEWDEIWAGYEQQ